MLLPILLRGTANLEMGDYCCRAGFGFRNQGTFFSFGSIEDHGMIYTFQSTLVVCSLFSLFLYPTLA